MNKIIGTFVPMSALFSLKIPEHDKGTFAAGFIFLDWLKKTHQEAWQMLPLNETQLEENSANKHVPSPYKGYGIGLNPQYLSAAFAQKYPTFQEKKMFLLQNRDWIKDYALFCSLRDFFHTDNWQTWDKKLRFRNKEALTYWREKLADKIDFYVIQQWQTDQSYAALRSKARELGIKLIGDLPFYISVQSPLVWTYQDVFKIEKNGSMTNVSGIPDINDTYFGRQVWGHPLYNWEQSNHKRKIILLWKTRIHYLAKIFDYIRFDHANGFFQYGVINMLNEKKDIYKEGPGAQVFEELIDYSRMQGLNVFVEDGGEKIHTFKQSVKKLNIAKSRVFSFSFSKNLNIIKKRYAEISTYAKNTVAYTSSHDTQTLLGFLELLDTKHKKILADATNVPYSPDNRKFATTLRSAILRSPAQMIIIPIQDWLLTTERINIPGTELPVSDPNWHFRLKMSIEELPTLFSNQNVSKK